MIHKYADVQTSDIGKDTNIWQYCVVLNGAKIGSNCNICASCFIESSVSVGNNVTIKNGVQLWDGIVIEDNVFIGPNVTFTNDAYPRSKNYPESFLSIRIKNFASIGANATILGGVIVGEFAMIGAGSLVTKDVLPYALVYGNPAKQHGWVCICGSKLEKIAQFSHLYCATCDITYPELK